MTPTPPINLPITPGTKLLRVEIRPDSFVLWLYTKDFKYGTYLELFRTGRIDQVTVEHDRYDVITLYEG